MTKEEIQKQILAKKKLNTETLEYFTNYFYVLMNSEWLESVDFNELLDNALEYSKIYFYDEQDEIYNQLGPDCKGLRDPETMTIYIRKNLEEPLREITIYHELHHAVQTNKENHQVGINQMSNFGRLIMEAQTQYFAEEVYQKIHGVHFEEREIPSEQLRMIPGGVVMSSLHNYEMYDSILTKLSILLEVEKDFFVNINFQYKDNRGIQKLREKYVESKKKYQFPYSFEEFMFLLDCIYCIDLLAYKENPAKETLLNGKETKEVYIIYEGIGYDKESRLSLALEFNYLDKLDRLHFMSLFDYNGEFQEFYKYLFKKETKNLAKQLIDTVSTSTVVEKNEAEEK